MSLHIGDTAPDFTVDTQNGEISLHDWAGDNWVFFFSHPADFTPVCTTEMGRTAQKGFTRAADAAQAGDLDTYFIAKRQVQGTCVACHEAYRIPNVR